MSASNVRCVLWTRTYFSKIVATIRSQIKFIPLESKKEHASLPIATYVTSRLKKSKSKCFGMRRKWSIQIHKLCFFPVLPFDISSMLLCQNLNQQDNWHFMLHWFKLSRSHVELVPLPVTHDICCFHFSEKLTTLILLSIVCHVLLNQILQYALKQFIK